MNNGRKLQFNLRGTLAPQSQRGGAAAFLCNARLSHWACQPHTEETVSLLNVEQKHSAHEKANTKRATPLSRLRKRVLPPPPPPQIELVPVTVAEATALRDAQIAQPAAVATVVGVLPLTHEVENGSGDTF